MKRLPKGDVHAELAIATSAIAPAATYSEMLSCER